MMNLDPAYLLAEAAPIYASVTKALIAQKKTISTMESCTSGLIASLLTDTEGASAVFPGGFVTYSNAGKTAAGVPEEIIARCGVYSSQTAAAMARAAKAAYHTDFAIGITGSFGNPDPNNADSVPNEVYTAILIPQGLHEDKITLPPASRLASKLLVAKALGEHLRAMLNTPLPD